MSAEEFAQEFVTFEQHYKVTHPEPQPPKPESAPKQSYWTTLLIGVTTLAAMIVSTAHSIGVIQGTFPGLTNALESTLISIATFVMVEGSTLLLSYLLARLIFRKYARYASSIVTVLILVTLVPVICAGWTFNFFAVQESFKISTFVDKSTVAGLAGSLPTFILVSMGFLFELSFHLHKDEVRRIEAGNTKRLQEFTVSELKPYHAALRRSFETKQRKAPAKAVLPRNSSRRVAKAEIKQAIEAYIQENPQAVKKQIIEDMSKIYARASVYNVYNRMMKISP